MRRIVIPGANNCMSEDFLNASYLDIVEIGDGEAPKKNRIQHSPKDEAALIDLIDKNHITDLISCKIPQDMIRTLATKKINLFIGVPVASTGKLIEDYMRGKLMSDERVFEEESDEWLD